MRGIKSSSERDHNLELTPEQLEQFIIRFYRSDWYRKQPLGADLELTALGLIQLVPCGSEFPTGDTLYRIVVTDKGQEFFQVTDKLLIAHVCVKYAFLWPSFEYISRFLFEDQLAEFIVHENQLIRIPAVKRMDTLTNATI